MSWCVLCSVFSSVGEREDWFHTLSRAIADHAAGLCTFGGPCSEVRGLFWNKAFLNNLQAVLNAVLSCMHPQAREKLWMALGEAAPVLVPVSHVMMCMNCTTDFSLTLRRHHCNACGKVSPTDATPWLIFTRCFSTWCMLTFRLMGGH